MLQVRDIVGPLRRVKGMYYGWWLVGVAALILTMAIGPFYYGMAAWFPVLERRFQWSRFQLAMGFSLTRVEGSITGPVGGHLIERLGPRRMALIGLLTVGGGFLLFSQIQNLWQFYLSYLIVSTGIGLGSWHTMMTVLNTWFIRRRATAMSMAIAGSALGGVVLLPPLAWAVDPDKFGLERWRDVAAGIGIVVLILAFPITRLVRNRPEDYGLRPDGDPAPDDSVAAQVGDAGPSTSQELDYTLREAMRTRNFWLISMGLACAAAATTTIQVHIGPMLHLDRGFSLQTVGLVVSTYMIVGMVFNLVGGYVGDRVSARLTIFLFSVIQSVAIVVLLLGKSVAIAFLFAVIMGIGFGGRHPLTASIRGVYFGRRSYASIMGISMIPMNILMLILPVLAGHLFDVRGSYTIAFTILAVVSFAGSSLFLFLGEPKPPPQGSSAQRRM